MRQHRLGGAWRQTVAVLTEGDFAARGVQRLGHLGVLFLALEVRDGGAAPVHLHEVHIPARVGRRVLLVVPEAADVAGAVAAVLRRVARKVAGAGVHAEEKARRVRALDQRREAGGEELGRREELTRRGPPHGEAVVQRHVVVAGGLHAVALHRRDRVHRLALRADVRATRAERTPRVPAQRRQPRHAVLQRGAAAEQQQQQRQHGPQQAAHLRDDAAGALSPQSLVAERGDAGHGASPLARGETAAS